MNILVVGNFGFGWDGSICDEEHISGALEELGHTVTRLQREESSGFGTTSDYDFTLVAQWDGYGDLSHLPKPLVYWAFDFQAQNQEWHQRLVSQSDLYLSKRVADSRYPHWRWLSQDFAPSFLKPHTEKVEKDIDVLFTGSYLDWATERNETLKAVDEKFNLVIHSVNDWPGFKDQRGPIMDDGLPGLYARAKCIVSIDHTIEAGYWSDRNAQIIACGRKPLFRYIPLSEARFGDRVDYFYNIEDCLEKVQKHITKPQYENRTDNLFVEDRVKDLLTIVKDIL